MKASTRFFRVAAGVASLLVSPLTLAQTCEGAGVQASNPMAAYLIDSANGTVTDRRSGLMWDRCAQGLSGTGCATGAALTFTWQAALNGAASLGSYKGFSDWRMPNLKELRSLVEECRGGAINEFAFPNTPAALFWSGSPYAFFATRSWVVGFDLGYATSDDRANSNYVRVVRAGQ